MTDAEISRLISMPKLVKNARARTIEQRGSERLNYEACGESGEEFRIYIRQNRRIPDGFSCGLLYLPAGREAVTLARYNGSDHEHTNPLESSTPIRFVCHIHRATERYMEAGRKADHYAETTARYSDLKGAIAALITDCNVSGLSDNSSEPDPQLSLL